MRDQNLEINPDFVAVLKRIVKGILRGGALSTNLYGNSLIIGAGARVRQILSTTATLDFPNTLAQTSQDLTVTLTGAADGDPVFLGVPNASVNANTCFTAWVSAADTVSVRHNNYSAGAVNPASGSFRVAVFRF